MAKADSDLELDDDIEAVQNDDEAEEVVNYENTKASLTKRRIIDNLLEERRLRKQLSDYDFDL